MEATRAVTSTVVGGSAFRAINPEEDSSINGLRQRRTSQRVEEGSTTPARVQSAAQVLRVEPSDSPSLDRIRQKNVFVQLLSDLFEWLTRLFYFSCAGARVQHYFPEEELFREDALSNLSSNDMRRPERLDLSAIENEGERHNSQAQLSTPFSDRRIETLPHDVPAVSPVIEQDLQVHVDAAPQLVISREPHRQMRSLRRTRSLSQIQGLRSEPLAEQLRIKYQENIARFTVPSQFEMPQAFAPLTVMSTQHEKDVGQVLSLGTQTRVYRDQESMAFARLVLPEDIARDVSLLTARQRRQYLNYCIHQSARDEGQMFVMWRQMVAGTSFELTDEDLATLTTGNSASQAYTKACSKYDALKALAQRSSTPGIVQLATVGVTAAAVHGAGRCIRSIHGSDEGISVLRPKLDLHKRAFNWITGGSTQEPPAKLLHTLLRNSKNAQFAYGIAVSVLLRNSNPIFSATTHATGSQFIAMTSSDQKVTFKGLADRAVVLPAATILCAGVDALSSNSPMWGVLAHVMLAGVMSLEEEDLQAISELSGLKKFQDFMAKGFKSLIGDRIAEFVAKHGDHFHALLDDTEDRIRFGLSPEQQRDVLRELGRGDIYAVASRAQRVAMHAPTVSSMMQLHHNAKTHDTRVKVLQFACDIGKAAAVKGSVALLAQGNLTAGVGQAAIGIITQLPVVKRLDRQSEGLVSTAIDTLDAHFWSDVCGGFASSLVPVPGVSEVAKIAFLSYRTMKAEKADQTPRIVELSDEEAVQNEDEALSRAAESPSRVAAIASRLGHVAHHAISATAGYTASSFVQEQLTPLVGSSTANVTGYVVGSGVHIVTHQVIGRAARGVGALWHRVWG